jgi:hypothetical protein
MPRFKNNHLYGDIEVFDGTSRINVAAGEEFEVTDEEAKNPTFADTDSFERVDSKKTKAKAGEDTK